MPNAELAGKDCKDFIYAEGVYPYDMWNCLEKCWILEYPRAEATSPMLICLPERRFLLSSKRILEIYFAGETPKYV